MEIRFDWLQQRYQVNLPSECRPQSIATGYDVFTRFHQLRIRETKIFSMSTTVFSKLSCKMVLGSHSLVVYNLYQKYILPALLRIVSTVIIIAELYCLNSVFMAFIAASFSNILADCMNFFLFELASFAFGSLESLLMHLLSDSELQNYYKSCHYRHLIFKKCSLM